MAGRALPDLVARLRLDDSDVIAAVQRINSGSTSIGKGLQGVEQAGAKMSQGMAQNLAVLLGHLQGVVPGAGALSEALGDAGKEGITLKGVFEALGPALPAAALVGGAVIAKNLADAFGETGSNLRQFELLSGASAEQASKLTYIMGAVGIDTQQAGQAFYILSKNIENSPDKFAALGIQIKKTNDGNIDSVATLDSVRKAWQNAGDAATRDTILYTAFGKAGKSMAEIMALDNEQFQQLEQHAGVFTQDQIERAHEYEITMNEVGQQTELLKAQLGSELAPTIEMIAEDFVAFSSDLEKVDEKLQAVGGISGFVTQAFNTMTFGGFGAVSSLLGVSSQSSKTKEDVQKLADAQNGGATSADNMAASENDLNTALQGVIGGLEGELPAQLALRKAQDDLTKAMQDGTKSEDDRETAALQVVSATVQEQEATEKAQGATIDAGTHANNLANAYDAVAKQLYAAGDPALAKQFEDMANRIINASNGISSAINSIPTTRNIQVTATAYLDPQLRALMAQGVPVGVIRAAQAGGPAIAGQPMIVGEAGPELFLPGQYGTIVPADRLQAAIVSMVSRIGSGRAVGTTTSIASIDQQDSRPSTMIGLLSEQNQLLRAWVQAMMTQPQPVGRWPYAGRTT